MLCKIAALKLTKVSFTFPIKKQVETGDFLHFLILAQKITFEFFQILSAKIVH